MAKVDIFTISLLRKSSIRLKYCGVFPSSSSSSQVGRNIFLFLPPSQSIHDLLFVLCKLSSFSCSGNTTNIYTQVEEEPSTCFGFSFCLASLDSPFRLQSHEEGNRRKALRAKKKFYALSPLSVDLSLQLKSVK